MYNLLEYNRFVNNFDPSPSLYYSSSEYFQDLCLRHSIEQCYAIKAYSVFKALKIKTNPDYADHVLVAYSFYSTLTKNMRKYDLVSISRVFKVSYTSLLSLHRLN